MPPSFAPTWHTLGTALMLTLTLALTACERSKPGGSRDTPSRVTVTAEAQTTVVPPATKTNQ